jgi:hypothetical protein
MATAERLAEAVSLDMISHWAPTERTYLGRITKAHIPTAVREGVSNEAVDRMADMKKQDMAEAAEQLLVEAALASRFVTSAYVDQLRRRGVDPLGPVGATVGPDQREAAVAGLACYQRVYRRWRIDHF